MVTLTLKVLSLMAKVVTKKLETIFEDQTSPTSSVTKFAIQKKTQIRESSNFETLGQTRYFFKSLFSTIFHKRSNKGLFGQSSFLALR